MRAVGVTCNVALSTAASVLATKREHIAAVTTPVGPNIGDRLEAMRDTMVDLLSVIIL